MRALLISGRALGPGSLIVRCLSPIRSVVMQVDHYALLTLLFFLAHVANFRPSTGDATQTSAVTLFVCMILFKQFVDPSILNFVPPPKT